jgi:hypothetical protein
MHILGRDVVGNIYESDFFASELAQNYAFHLAGIKGAKVGEEGYYRHVHQLLSPREANRY